METTAEERSAIMREIGQMGGRAAAQKPKAFRTWRATKAANARWAKYKIDNDGKPLPTKVKKKPPVT